MEESVDLHEEGGKENEKTLANLSPAEEPTSKDEVEIEKFLQEQKSKNTQHKTKCDLNAWKKFCESQKKSRAIENIPANELDHLLSKFFISVRKQNGTEYEPGTLSGFQRSFQRYLHEKGSLINILRDNEFSKSREVLAAKRKNLVRQGKGNCPNATRELTEAEEDALFENGQFGVHDPKSLQRALWWFLSLHFGWRARDESRKLCWGDVGLATDPEIPNTSCGSQKEEAKHALDKMVVIREPSNPKRTQATTSQDAQLNFKSLSKSPFRSDARTRCSFLSRHKSPKKTNRQSMVPRPTPRKE